MLYFTYNSLYNKKLSFIYKLLLAVISCYFLFYGFIIVIIICLIDNLLILKLFIGKNTLTILYLRMSIHKISLAEMPIDNK